MTRLLFPILIAITAAGVPLSARAAGPAEQLLERLKAMGHADFRDHENAEYRRPFRDLTAAACNGKWILPGGVATFGIGFRAGNVPLIEALALRAGHDAALPVVDILRRIVEIAGRPSDYAHLDTQFLRDLTDGDQIVPIEGGGHVVLRPHPKLMEEEEDQQIHLKPAHPRAVEGAPDPALGTDDAKLAGLFRLPFLGPSR